MDGNKNIAKEWWAKRRLRYNIGLLVAGFGALILFLIIGSPPHKFSPDDDGINIVLQGPAYLFMIGIANVFYYLGYYVDSKYNKDNTDSFRKKLYNLGFWFSVGLPFLLPLLLLIDWLF